MGTPGMWYDGWISIKKETIYGTDPGGAREACFRVNNLDVVNDQGAEPYPSMAGPGVRGHVEGDVKASISFEVPMNYEGTGRILKALFGTYAFTANSPVAGVNKHAFSFSNIATLDSYAVEACIGDIPSGKVFLLTGATMNSATIKMVQGGMVVMAVEMIAKHVAPNITKVGTPVYAADHPIMSHNIESPMFSGTGKDVKALEMTIAHAMTDDRRNMKREISQPLRGDNRTVTGTAMLEFDDLTIYNKMVGLTSGTFDFDLLSLEMAALTTPFELDFIGSNCLVKIAETGIKAVGPIDMPVSFQMRSATSEITAELYNTETTYA